MTAPRYNPATTTAAKPAAQAEWWARSRSLAQSIGMAGLVLLPLGPAVAATPMVEVATTVPYDALIAGPPTVLRQVAGDTLDDPAPTPGPSTAPATPPPSGDARPPVDPSPPAPTPPAAPPTPPEPPSETVPNSPAPSGLPPSALETEGLVYDLGLPAPPEWQAPVGVPPAPPLVLAPVEAAVLALPAEVRAAAAAAAPVTPERVDHWRETIGRVVQATASGDPDAVAEQATRHVTLDAVADSPTLGWSYAVRPGDSLWRIGEQVWGPAAALGDLDATWRLLHAFNPQLDDDPDLIFPGQVIAIPVDTDALRLATAEEAGR